MRTQYEIAARVRIEQGKILSFASEVLVPFLDAEHAVEFIKPEFIADWKPTAQDDATIREEMRAYMAGIGWDKAESHRGISAGRTVEKMGSWLWLLGDDEMVAFADDEDNYPQYGAPILAAICRKYGFPIPDSPELANMIEGRPCEPGCDMGCGR